MANNLTPEQLAALRAMQYQNPSAGSGWSPGTADGPSAANTNYTDPNGNTYHVIYNGIGSAQDGGVNYSPTGYAQDLVPGHNSVGDSQNIYDPSGNYNSTGKIQKESALSAYGPFLSMLPAFGAAMSPALNSAMSFGTNSVLSGGGLGEGALAGGLSAGSVNVPGAATVGGPMSVGGAPGTDLGPLSASGGGTYPGAAMSSDLVAPAGLGSTAGTTAGWGAGSTLGKLSSLLGLAAPIAGAIAGSQPQKTTVSAVKALDPRMDGLVYGNANQTGLLNYANQQLAKDMAPGGMPGWDQMKTVGQGLLSQPIAGNGFSKFYPGR